MTGPVTLLERSQDINLSSQKQACALDHVLRWLPQVLSHSTYLPLLREDINNLMLVIKRGHTPHTLLTPAHWQITELGFRPKASSLTSPFNLNNCI